MSICTCESVRACDTCVYMRHMKTELYVYMYVNTCVRMIRACHYVSLHEENITEVK